MKEGVKERR